MASYIPVANRICDIPRRKTFNCPKTRWKFLLPIYIFFVIILNTIDARSTYKYPTKYTASYDSWENILALEESGAYIVEWTPLSDRVLFRVSARTSGYIGFGLSANPTMDGADIVVGWVHSGKVYLQDRHGVGNQPPLVDKQQDWDLIGGHENDTHTVLIMSRPYHTCDPHDHSITNDTVRLLWAYHPDDPVDPGSPRPRLHYHMQDRRGAATVFLLQRSREIQPLHLESPSYQSLHFHKEPYQTHSPLISWSMVGETATISSNTESLHWCRVFKRPPISQKHHVVKYEPVITPGNNRHIQHMMVYECIQLNADNESLLERMASTSGNVCVNENIAQFLKYCNHILVAWTVGSEGVWLPPEAGYPLEPYGPSFYILETHYGIPEGEILSDASGIRLVYTPELRTYDAGVLSVGVDPNWKHLIPPNQETVVSEGHCIADCLSEVVPRSGINVFGVIFHTHMLGRQVRLKHIRGSVEFEPIAEDMNYDVNYQEYRVLREHRKVLPGDHLVGQCIYNSQKRSTITLGGFKTRDEMCLTYLFYYPRVDMSFCHSRPSLGTVLQSLGIQELGDEENRITIKRPKELAGKSLKWRLQNYDWENQFDHFQKATHSGTFNPTCKNRGGNTTMNIEEKEYNSPVLSQEWKAEVVCEKSRENRQPPTTDDKLIESDLMFDDDRHLKPIETVDVDPIQTSDYLMPVIGDTYTPPKPDHIPLPPSPEPINDLLEELEEVERDIENEIHSHNTLNFSPERTSHKQSSASEIRYSHVVSLLIFLVIFNL